MPGFASLFRPSRHLVWSDDSRTLYSLDFHLPFVITVKLTEFFSFFVVTLLFSVLRREAHALCVADVCSSMIITVVHVFF